MFCIQRVGGRRNGLYSNVLLSCSSSNSGQFWFTDEKKNKTSNHMACQNWHVQLSSYSNSNSKPNNWSPHPSVSNKIALWGVILDGTEVSPVEGIKWYWRCLSTLLALSCSWGSFWGFCAHINPCTSYCGKAAERNQSKEQLQHGSLAQEGCSQFCMLFLLPS